MLRDDPETARASQRARGEDPGIVDDVLGADERRRSTLADFERLRAEQKAYGKKVAQAKGPEKAELVSRAKQLSEQVKSRQQESDEAAERLEALLRRLPNIVESGVPAGGEDDFEVLETIGTPRDFAAEGFTPLDHLELGERLGAIDTDRGAKVAGARFYYLTGPGARLELGMLMLAVARAVEHGFTPMITPTPKTIRSRAPRVFLSRSSASSSSHVSYPLTPRSEARMTTTGMPLSTRVTSTPAITS